MFDDDLIETATSLRAKVDDFMDKTQLQNALAEIFKLVSRANKYIDETAPWVIAKDETKKARLATVLYNLLEAIRIACTLLSAFVPATKTATSSVFFLLMSRFTREMHSSHELMLKRKLKNSTASSRTTRVKVKKQRHSVKSSRVLHRLALMTLQRLTSVCARLRPANPLKRAKSFYSSQFLTV